MHEVTADDLDKLKHTEQMIQEILRMYPPAASISKELPKGGMVMSGYQIPEYSQLMFRNAVMCRNPEYFNDPDTFDPSRVDADKIRPGPFVYFPFGIGYRTCIGRHFAMAKEDVVHLERRLKLWLKDEVLQSLKGKHPTRKQAIHTALVAPNSPPELVPHIILFDTLNAELIRKVSMKTEVVLINTYREDIDLFVDGATLLSTEGTTQGDPLAMAMYGIGILPLIKKLQTCDVTQTWYADDAAAAGSTANIRCWWDMITKAGPMFGYYPNASKTHLIVKQEYVQSAKGLFDGSGITVIADGDRYLGAAIGTRTYIEHSELFIPLENAIRTIFLPSLTGQSPFNDTDRNMLALQTRLGGLGIINPSLMSLYHYTTSVNVTSALANLVITRATLMPSDLGIQQLEEKNLARNQRKAMETASVTELLAILPAKQKRSVEIASEKGASSWLNALPIARHGFALHKSAFRDAICLRYGWQPPLLPSHCICGSIYTVEHAMNCPSGGFPSIRHNEVRDLTSAFLSEVCHNVHTEPTLQPLQGEHLKYKSANGEVGARLDVAAQNFWGKDHQTAYFDVRIFNPFAQSYANSSMSKCYRKHELDKKREYEERVREIEHESFSPLVFSTAGGMGPIATTVYKRIASLIADKRQEPYSTTLFWLRCKLSFSLLRSAIMCLRGTRSFIPTHNTIL
eukprot:Em0020g416a